MSEQVTLVDRICTTLATNYAAQHSWFTVDDNSIGVNDDACPYADIGVQTLFKDTTKKTGLFGVTLKSDGDDGSTGDEPVSLPSPSNSKGDNSTQKHTLDLYQPPN